MIESGEEITIHENKKKWLNEQHTDRVGTQLYMSPEQVNNVKLCIHLMIPNYFENNITDIWNVI